jgi:serine/threonine protein kinase
MHKLNHPHMLKFYDWYETKNNLWVILEYCTGGNLETILQQDGHLPESAIRIFGMDMVAGLKVRGSALHFFDFILISIFSIYIPLDLSTVISDQRTF